MASPPSAGGTKRSPENEKADQGSDTTGAITGMGQRTRSKHLRLLRDGPSDLKSKLSDPSANGGGSNGGMEAPAGNIGNADVLSKLSCFLDVGPTLFNLCVAVGKRSAASIRAEYLLENDAYLVLALERLKTSVIDSPEKGMDDALMFQAFRSDLDRCRDDILAWMKVNEKWRERCSCDGLQRYKTFRVEAGLVFNNPVVAIELGLFDVVRFLVDEKGVSVTAKEYDGIFTRRGYVTHYRWMADMAAEFGEDSEFVVPPGENWNNRPISLALSRDDAAICEFLLSSDAFQLSRLECEHENDEIINLLLSAQGVCRQILWRHPKIDLNIIGTVGSGYDRNMTPLLCLIHGFEVVDICGESYQLDKLECLREMVECGADPNFGSPHRYTPMEYATQKSRQKPDSVWKVVVETMEKAQVCPRED